MTIESLYNIFESSPDVQTDTRLLKPGDIFFALKGPHFNGNAFAQQALEAGAGYAVVDEAAYVTNERVILVEDVLTCLHHLALHHRQKFQIPFIAITGSNGKTTTKELVSKVLAGKKKTYTTQGNLNNHIGIPLTILRVKKDAEIAIIEMGANHQKEIEGYCEYTLPTHGIITNCGKAHLEGFGGIEGVRKGKGELFDFLRKHNGSAFVMWDYDYLRQMSKSIPEVIKYGTEGDVFVKGRILRSEPYLAVTITGGGNEFSLQTQLVGDYNLPNVLAAVTVGRYFGVEDALIKQAIESYTPSNSRSQLLKKNGNTVILDAYNANPSSMKAAIENFAAMHAGQKILLLGAMAELGKESLQEHKNLLQLIGQFKWKEVVLVGGDFMKIEHPYHLFANAQEAAAWLKAQHFTDAHLLVKGSRSMQMEKVLES